MDAALRIIEDYPNLHMGPTVSFVLGAVQQPIGSVPENEQTGRDRLNRLLNTYDILHGKGDFLSVIPIAEYIANKDLGPMLESLVNLKKTSIILKSAPSLWNRYFDSGLMELELLDAEKNFSVLYLDEIADENRASGVAVCNFVVPEWFKTGLTMSGANSAEIVHTECRYKNPKPCRFEVWWE